MSYARTWINLEDIILNDISSHRRAILYDSTYMRYLKLSKSSSQEVEWWLPGLEEEKQEVLFNGIKFPLSKLTAQSRALLDSNVSVVANAALSIKNLYRVDRAHAICSHYNKNT